MPEKDDKVFRIKTFFIMIIKQYSFESQSYTIGEQYSYLVLGVWT